MQLWQPSSTRQESSSLTDFCLLHAETQPFASSFDYRRLHRWSVDHIESFWSTVWEFCGVIGEKGDPLLVDGDKMPGARWFPGARLNFAENILCERPENETSIVFWGEDRVRASLTFGELKRQVTAIASYFRASGIGPGDRIAAYIHNGPEAIIGMLAAASIGALWSSCSPDFGAQSVLDRFGQITPKALIASDGYFYKGKSIDRTESIRAVLAGLPSVETTLIVSYVHSEPQLDGLRNALTWREVLEKEPVTALSYTRLPFDHPLYIMFSSGTTGAPKCIVHGAGGVLLQHLKEHQLHCDIKPGDRVLYATSTGWMMWNWLASVLASKATILLYDGFFSAGEKGALLLDYASTEAATFFGTSAGYLKAIEKEGLKPRETHPLPALRVIASTGSPLLPDSFDYVYRDFKADVQLASISGGTDILSCFVLGNPWSPVERGEIQGAGLGMAVEIWDDDGRPLIGEQGELVCVRPFPSMPIGFWNDPDGKKYTGAYFEHFPGVWRHGDFATQTQNQGFQIHGRSDATLNPQGVRIGTADIYSVVEGFSAIEEALAVDHQGSDGGRIVLFVKMREGHRLDDDLATLIKRALFEKASPRHVPALIIEAPALPHTRSGKLVELAVRDAMHGRPIKNTGALANPEALAFFADLPQLKQDGN